MAIPITHIPAAELSLEEALRHISGKPGASLVWPVPPSALAFESCTALAVYNFDPTVRLTTHVAKAVPLRRWTTL